MNYYSEEYVCNHCGRIEMLEDVQQCNIEIEGILWDAARVEITNDGRVICKGWMYRLVELV